MLLFSIIALPVIIARFISEKDIRKAIYNYLAWFPFLFFMSVGMKLYNSSEFLLRFYLAIIFFSFSRCIWELFTIKIGEKGVFVAYVIMFIAQILFYIKWTI